PSPSLRLLAVPIRGLCLSLRSPWNHDDALGASRRRTLNKQLCFLEEHAIALHRYATQPLRDETSERHALRLLLRFPDQGKHRAGLGAPATNERAVRPPNDEVINAIELVLDLADDLFDHIFQGHNARGPAVFVDNDRQVMASLLEVAQELLNLRVLPDEHCRPAER